VKFIDTTIRRKVARTSRIVFE